MRGELTSRAGIKEAVEGCPNWFQKLTLFTFDGEYLAYSAPKMVKINGTHFFALYPLNLSTKNGVSLRLARPSSGTRCATYTACISSIYQTYA